jgi:hypothetical protein
MRATVINLFGGPNVGKSTYAAHLYAQMKIRGLSVALVNEVAQEMIFEGRMDVLEGDQLLVFAEQNRKVLRVANRFDYVISDSPIILSNIYFNEKMCIYDKASFQQFVLSTFNQYRNVNIFLERAVEWGHNMAERRHNAEEARELDMEIRNYLAINRIPFRAVENNIAKAEIGAVVPEAA